MASGQGKRHWISVDPAGFCVLVVFWLIGWTTFLVIIGLVLLVTGAIWLGSEVGGRSARWASAALLRERYSLTDRKTRQSNSLRPTAATSHAG